MSIADRVFDGEDVKELIGMKREFSNNWSRIEEYFAGKYEEKTALDERNAFLEIIVDSKAAGGSGYLATIQSLSADEKRKGTVWLQSIVDHIADRVFDLIPSYRK